MWIEERLCDVKRGCVTPGGLRDVKRACVWRDPETQVFWTAGQLLFFGTVWQCHCLDRSELYLLRIKKIVLKSDVASGGVLLSPHHYLSERHSPWSLNTNHHNIMMGNIWCLIWNIWPCYVCFLPLNLYLNISKWINHHNTNMRNIWYMRYLVIQCTGCYKKNSL